MLRLLALSGSALLLTAGFVQPVLAQDSSQSETGSPIINNSGNAGVCGQIYYLSGRSVILPEDGLVSLTDYCTAVRASITAVSTTGEEFWQKFLEVASPSAIEFANTVGRDEVVAYGATICPTLEGGTSLQEIREVQSEGDLPPGFDASVNVAAIHTYCPQYRSQIGR